MSDMQAYDEKVSEGTQSVVRILHYLFWGLRILIVLLIVAFLFSGVFILSPNEHALIFEFGRLDQVVKEPRLYLSWPKPIARHLKLPVESVKELRSSDFWYKEEARSVLSQPDQAAAQTQEDPLEPGNGGYLLTADDNILHTSWSVAYDISDAKAYYKNYEDPQAALRYALRNVVLKQGARTSFDTAFKDGTNQFRNKVQQELTRLVGPDEMNIGIQIVQVNYERKSVPRSTRQAFDEVINAGNAKDAAIKAASGDRKKMMKEADGEAASIVAEAQAYRQTITDSVAADAQYLQQIEAQYEESGPSILLTHYIDTLTEVIKQAEQIIVLYPDQEVRITIHPQAPGPADEQDDQHPQH